jgi:rod shape determining protein RodA
MFEKSLTRQESSIDWPLWASLLGLIVFGAAFVFSATTASEAARDLPWYQQRFFVMQLIWYAVGVAGAVAICFIDYHILARWSLVGYWVTIVLLVVVLTPVGTVRMGARRWIDLGPASLQPSEFAKLAFIFVQAHFLSRPVDELRLRPVFWKAIGLTALPFLLILKEPDLGSALIFLPIGLVMLFVAGVPVRYLINLLGALGVLVALLLVDVLFAPPGWYKLKLEDYQRHRLLVYFGLDFAPKNASPEEKLRSRRLQEDKSYQVRQALISVGSGGVLGKGWREGSQTALGFLPPGTAHNDFIFSVIAEEKGFMGSVMVITLYSVVLFTGVRIAGQARDRLGKLLAVGVITLFFSHVFINIGMNIRMMPVTGVPLPLLSYGGSSVLCSLIAAGILQNVYLYRRAY